jgi:NADPH:quinone reductase-like Zn-dependent oxidoreductase
MQQLVTCDLTFYESYQDDPRLCLFKLDEVPLYFALLAAQPSPFDPLRQPNGVLIRKRAFSCNYRDRGVLFGVHAVWPPNNIKPNLLGFGSEFVAEVLATGSHVTTFTQGDLVMGEVSYPAPPAPGVAPGIPSNQSSVAYDVFHESKLIRVPIGLSLAEAASFSIGAVTSHSMIRRLNLQSEDRVLVTSGRSNTSLFVLEMLKKYGIPTYTICSDPAFDDRFRALGVENIFHLRMPLTTEAEKAEWNQIQALGLTAIIDPFFDLHVASAVKWLNVGGRYVTCGLFNQYFEVIGQTDRASQYDLDGVRVLLDVMTKNINIIGNCIGTREDMDAALADAEASQWHVPIDSVWQGAAGIQSFLHRTFNAPDRFGKVVFLYD